MKKYKTREDLEAEKDVEHPIWSTGDVANWCYQPTHVVRALAKEGMFLDAKVRKHPRYIPAQVVAAWSAHLAELRRAYA